MTFGNENWQCVLSDCVYVCVSVCQLFKIALTYKTVSWVFGNHFNTETPSTNSNIMMPLTFYYIVHWFNTILFAQAIVVSGWTTSWCSLVRLFFFTWTILTHYWFSFIRDKYVFWKYIIKYHPFTYKMWNKLWWHP